MSQKVLIAFDDSENAMRAVEYAARILAKDCRITLFSVVQDTASICDLHSPELTPYFKAQQDSFCALEEKKRQLISSAALKAKEILAANGFREDQIQLRSEAKKKGIARDIVAEAQSGYDLVVLGRRGLAGIRDFFMGSVSQKVLSLAQDLPILVVS